MLSEGIATSEESRHEMPEHIQISPPEGREHVQAPTYSPEILKILRKSGAKKPAEVSWGDWIGLKNLSGRMGVIAYYAATGWTPGQIARTLGMSASRLSVILSSSRMKAMMQGIQQDHYGTNVAARFKDMVPKAQDVVEGILDNPNEKSSLRLAAASEVFNRAHGKPAQTIEIQNNSIKDIFEFLDKHRTQPKPLDLSHDAPQSKPDLKLSVIEAEFSEQPDQTKTDIDSWINENIPEDSGIGKKKT